jgi:protein-tyrosine phosphatase
VLTVAARTNLSYVSSDIEFHEVIWAEDMPNFDLSRYFDKCLNFIEKCRKKTNVLVHCFAGVSRSASIIIAYLMKINGWTVEKSFNFVRDKRRVIGPNPGFMK